jgi:hypothetical protein
MLFWQIFGEIAPLTARTRHITQRIHNLTEINVMGSTWPRFLLNKRFDKAPFCINKITWIAERVHLFALFDIFSCFHEKLLRE